MAVDAALETDTGVTRPVAAAPVIGATNSWLLLCATRGAGVAKSGSDDRAASAGDNDDAVADEAAPDDDKDRGRGVAVVKVADCGTGGGDTMPGADATTTVAVVAADADDEEDADVDDD